MHKTFYEFYFCFTKLPSDVCLNATVPSNLIYPISLYFFMSLAIVYEAMPYSLYYIFSDPICTEPLIMPIIFIKLIFVLPVFIFSMSLGAKLD